MNLNSLEDATVIQIGSSLIRLDAILDLNFSWNNLANEKSNYAYNVDVTYGTGTEKRYTCSKDKLFMFLVALDETGYTDGKYSLVDFENFVENLHQKYYDQKALNKARDNEYKQNIHKKYDEFGM